MRTANNTNNFTVEALVAKYRNYVEKHASYEIIGDDDFNMGSWEYGLDGWPDHQLLITLYGKGLPNYPKTRDQISQTSNK